MHTSFVWSGPAGSLRSALRWLALASLSVPSAFLIAAPPTAFPAAAQTAVASTTDAQAAASSTGYAAHSLLGGYLAGRIARGQHDTAAAAGFYTSALMRDPDNEALSEQALLMDVTEGRFDNAVRLAERFADDNPPHRISQLVLGLSDAKAGRYLQAQTHFQASATNVIGELTAGLAVAWTLAAQNDVKGAIETLDNIKQAELAQFYVRYHKALILDFAGRRQEAGAMYERIFRGDSKALRLTLAYAQHASAVGDQKLARSILEEHARKTGGTFHPVARALYDRLKGGERAPLLIESANDGLSEVFYGLGEALSNEGGVSVGAIYLQMALYLKSDSPFALAALANVYEATKKYEDAIKAYDRIQPGSGLEAAIDIRKALNLNQLDRVDEAKAILEKQAAANPTDIKPLDALGTIMRGRKRFAEAVDYYTRALHIIGPKPDKKYWTYFYARGTSYERIKKWPLAEADLQKALQLSPDQPLVLNYLGYSWVDQRRNLRRGLALIEKAVQLKPDDGYIVDSLGWAQYRLGNFKDAVRNLEKAVELKPEDPVLNDHLGDALWHVGRQTEARYQWSQALTLNPEPEDAERIKRKLGKGLTNRPQSRTAKRPTKEALRTDGPKRQTRFTPPRPVVQ
jgi:tetratricopeptide (TPR) repeat protein